jgi:hypothetical protein
MDSSPQKILLIGGHNTGKTVFGTQLFGRLREGSSSLSLRSPPSNLSVFEDALDRLNEGCAPEHTPLSVHDKLILPVETEEEGEIDVEWPDYGGEQIDSILESRQVPSRWQDRITKSNGWLLFVRPSLLGDYDDVISRSLGKLVRSREESGDEEVEWCDQARLIELLQIFLFFRGLSASEKTHEPVLTVVLSCWDEIETSEQKDPPEFLREHLPLLYTFLSTRWHTKAWSVIGLSALGRSLSEDEPDTEYVEKGPTSFGYVINADGEKSADLTRPLIDLIR